MAETLDLTTPITSPARTSYRLSALTLDWDNQVIRVSLVGSDGTTADATYSGAAAVSLMTTLNTANLTTTSLHKRVLNKLVQDGKLPAGTVTGTPS